MSDDNELTTCSCVFSSLWSFCLLHSIVCMVVGGRCVLHMLSIIKVYTVSLISGCVVN